MPPFLAVVALGLACTALAACGGDESQRNELLSPAAAARLRATLASVEQRVDIGDCTGAEQQSEALAQRVGSLSTRVDAGLRAALAAGSSRLRALVIDHCEASTTGPTGPTSPTGATGVQEEQQPNEENKPSKEEKKAAKKKAKKHEIPTEPDSGGTQVPPDAQGEQGQNGE
jgi:hypothetical protein